MLKKLVVGEIMAWYHRMFVMLEKYGLEFDTSIINFQENMRFVESHNRISDEPIPFEHKILGREELPDDFDINQYNPA